MRKTSLKALLLRAPSAQTHVPHPEQDTDWGLLPTEHAWMLSAVDGSYESLLEFISSEPLLLNRRDSISGFAVLHWLAKRGQDETLLQLVHYAQRVGIPVDVDHAAALRRGQSPGGSVRRQRGRHGPQRQESLQYLPADAPPAMQELLGMWDDEQPLDVHAE
ncbi:unnamed protein product [Tetraodon nigroviridis]|uniref:(spotted green pufferfish) hypothetical protein n=1 Tax=Tetraodon nigroviridis TaxID=99883 RepID=Q4RTC9_TETNG|nr:unnamed protein product [Tetraodon nigroviridis]